jgi:hypothetical protein
MILALSGRRIDPPGSNHPRFPLQSAGLVRQRISDLFKRLNANTLVCSAACGADLLALEGAESLGMRTRIILPFAPARFRETSVVDRPGDWGPLFDRIVVLNQPGGDVVDLQLSETVESYTLANEAILEEASSLSRAQKTPFAAALVWDGASKGSDDFTGSFRKLARARGLEIHEVSTL